MSQLAASQSNAVIPRDIDGNIDVHAWAKANLDPEIIAGTSGDMHVH